MYYISPKVILLLIEVEALEMVLKTSHSLYPPFANGVATAPLVSISFTKLEAGDTAESQAFFKASGSAGFFYINFEGSALGEKIVSMAEQLHLVQKNFAKLPDDEKDQFARKKLGSLLQVFILHETKNHDGVTRRDETCAIFGVSHLLSESFPGCSNVS